MTTSSIPPSSSRAGTLIAGKYRVDSMLGEGGMGTVWAATHVDLGQPVALKLISSELARSADLLARFKAEAKAAAKLQSRYVVRMYDSGVTDDGRPYIAMEYLRGESLEDRLNRLGALPVAATVRIVSQVCKALKLAHAQNIIHRDLKPANIFLATTGDEEEVAKVLDFGIAKIMHPETDHGATATGIIMGTPLYMSPEQARALKTLDHRSDLYSLGMVTYRMLVGDPPFHGESFGDLVFSICTKPLPSMHQQVPSLPPSLDTWFQTACAKEPDARFANAEDMANALWSASGLSSGHLQQIDTGGHSMPGGMPYANSNTGSAYTTEPSAGVYPSQTGSTGGARATLVGNAQSAQTGAGRTGSTTGATAVPMQEQRRGSVVPLIVGGVAALAGAAALAFFLLREPGTTDTEGPNVASSNGTEPPSLAHIDPTEQTASNKGGVGTENPTGAEEPSTGGKPATGKPNVQVAGSEPNSAEERDNAVAAASGSVAVNDLAPDGTGTATTDDGSEREATARPSPRPRPARPQPAPTPKEPESGPNPATGSGKSGTPDMGF